MIYIFIIYNIYKKESYTSQYHIPKNIFTYWHSSNMDLIISYHIEIWKKKLPDWNITVVTLDNIDYYVDKKYYTQFLNLSPQHFADHIRLYLLEKFGGLWMDGSILIKNPYFIYNLYDSMYNKNSEIGLFEYKVNTINNNYPYLENWFIMAPINSTIIKIWKSTFDKCQKTDKDIEICRKNIIDSGINIDKTIKNHNYLMQHAVLNMLCNNKKININDIYILQATDSMFYIQDSVDWDVEKIGEIILSDKIKKYNNVYAIKYTKYTRTYLNDRFELYKKSIDSIL